MPKVLFDHFVTFEVTERVHTESEQKSHGRALKQCVHSHRVCVCVWGGDPSDPSDPPGKGSESRKLHKTIFHVLMSLRSNVKVQGIQYPAVKQD